MKKDRICFLPGESRRQGAVWRRHIFAYLMLRAHAGPSFFSVRFGDARWRLRKTPPVGFEPWTFRSEVLTSSAAANPPPTIPRESVPLKGRLVSPPSLGRLLVWWFRYPPFPLSALALRWFRFSSSVSLSVVSSIFCALSVSFGVGRRGRIK